MINHQQQPTGTSCVSACIAMILNKPVNDIIGEFHDNYHNEKVEVDDYLAKKGVVANNPIEWNKIYIVVVPSLDHNGKMSMSSTHQVLMDTTCNKTIIHDPLKGTHYYYSMNASESKMAVAMTMYRIEGIIDANQLKEARGQLK